ncbi:membrane protein [Kaistia sp. 32K]|uniref:AsmA-like C-terminal region-containing protein n=1 Tax=Kaistia sp. 32K TaxID=2795690 RepID=UPI001939134B|nr:AsmA-like C-terminal region-containing protein [Kaistia sp. 32K]BCP53076.1 membrane protein [Kaistia sp. 32K]
MIVVGMLAAIVFTGPVEFDVVRERVIATLSSRLGPDYGVKVGRTTIDVDPVLGLVVEVDEVSIRDRDDAVVGRVPAARLAIDPLSLLRLRLDVRTIEISDADISLVRSRAGRVYLGTPNTIHRAERAQTDAAPAQSPAPAEPVAAEPPGEIDGGFPDLITALRTLNGALDPAIELALDRGFERLSIDASTIQVWDASRLQQRTFGHTDIALTVDAETGTVKANFDTSGYAGRWGIIAERTVDDTTGARMLSLVFSQLSLADINPDLGRPDSQLQSDVPLFGRATVRLNEKGEVENAAVRLDLGAGNIVSGIGKDTVLLDEATIRLRWDVPRRTIVVEPSSLFFGDTRMVVAGEVKPLSDKPDGRYSFNLESRNAMLFASDANAPPIIADRIAIVGTADIPARRLDFTDAAINTQGGSIAAAGSLGFDGATPSLAMAASFSPMAISTLKQMWPPFLAGGARKWVYEHVHGGTLEAGRFEAAVPAGVLWTGERVILPEDNMRLDMRLEDVSFTTIGNIPSITGASGNAVLAGSTFGVDMEKGLITAPSGKTLDVTVGAFAISNTAQRFPEGHIELQLEGDVGAMAEIADSEPILAMQRRSIDPATLSGRGQASISVKLPLKPGLTPSEVDWRVGLTTSGFASATPIEGKTIKNGALSMVATPAEVSIHGKATINGVQASIDLAQPLGDADGDGDGDEGRRKITLSLDAQARKQLGIGLDDVIGGTVGATVSDLGDGAKGQHYELDLKQARLVLQSVGWSKGIGVPAKLSFDLKPTKNGFAVDNMVATGDGFGFRGKAVLDAKYGLISAELENLALRKGDKLSVSLSRKGNGYSIVARGPSFDVRGLIAQYKAAAAGPNENAADISVDAKVGTLIGFNQATLSDAALVVQSRGGTVRKATVEGVLDSGGISLSYADSGDQAELRVNSGDAGSVFRFIDIYSRITGGRLTMTGRRVGATGPFSGIFDVLNFRIVGEPSMARLVSATNGSGPAATRTGVDPNNVPFDRMRLDYTKRGSIVVIDDAILRGATVGATFNGTLDLARQTVSLAGTYLPAYAFNNLFGKLPIIGLALGGGSQGGLIGVTFKVEGKLNAPSLMINPLSAITPGIFRKIFEFPVN